MARYQVTVGKTTFTVDDSLLYTQSDEWVKVEGDSVRVGITDYAQRQLKDIVGVDLPKVGQEVHENMDLAVLESVKATAEVYSPVNGVVKEVNEALLDRPELINKEPYDGGWIAVIEVKGGLDKSKFLDHQAYVNNVKSRSK
ncbi:Probable glycine cleavage system H protein 1 [Acidilobus saccharovorans 345-15]|uniref:Probable glycine cleavage system H protein n=1 Tax=Acidilobus saccharovorans (strain DSM 16705 / JCM 18335 / VKM B-2471 / 345-15) TaxID=666510 RepID=D9PZ63_ACIS3|nr:glycine cleavage system protein GcvH [Acidilobus saccharovorans]ADL19850.1 Probable glycine cleavage system H protein 1 [Acidilobus saccharovorans 345-15]